MVPEQTLMDLMSEQKSLTFNGDIPSNTASRTLASGKTFTVNHNADGSGSATIYWKWGVNSPGEKYKILLAVLVITLTKINKYTISYNANGGSGAPSAQTKNTKCQFNFI